MRIAIDVSPLQTGHKVRGTGFYLEHLKKALVKYHPENEYVFFERGEKLPEGIDLIHFPYFEPFFLALPIYKKYKTVVTVHDLTPIVFPAAFPRGIKGEAKWQMQRYALKQADVILTDSEASRKDIVKYVGAKESRIHVVYLAAGEDFRQMANGKWQIELRKKYNLPEKFILYVGDVTWNKNLPRLIDAVKEVGAPIVMIGKNLTSENYDKDNPWNADLNRVNELARGERKIIRLGFVPDKDLIEIYNLATVFVMPSLYEGFGLPILEAMACGCPVITSKEGSIPEVARDAAFYVDAYNLESIASGIKKVFGSENLKKQLREKGLENAKKFSWKKTAGETIKAYERVVGK
jgi:glycosyltransferase involved in cell wall biosynthesis